MSESDLRDANLRADKLQAQRDAAVALLRNLVAVENKAWPNHVRQELAAVRAFLETL